MKLLFFLSSFLCVSKSIAQLQKLVIGTYDSPKSEGIYVYDFNSLDGSAKRKDFIKTSNPSYVAISPNHKTLLAVNENANEKGTGGTITSFTINKNGSLTELNSQSSQGNHPCYIAIDKSGKWAIAANYSTGNFAVLPINKNGSLETGTQIIQFSGSSIDTIRQSASHVHTCFFSENNEQLFVTDLGTDKIMLYNFDENTGKVKPTSQKYISVNGGSGPRHIDISKNNFLYVIMELTGAVSVFSLNDNFIKNIQTISTLPKGFEGTAGSADIHISPDENFLYASNRGTSNTIAIYKINKKNGTLSLISHQSTLGISPRNFNFDKTGKYLLVANQNSDEVVIFKRNLRTGLLTDTGNRIVIGKPVCIKFM